MFQHRGLEVDLCAAWRIFVGRPARFFALGREQNLSLSFDAAKIQHLHCGLRIFHKKFSKKFSRTEKVDSHICCSVAVLQCCSSRVNPFQYEICSYIIYLYIYKYIIQNFFLTFTLSVFELQHCNNCNTLFRSIAFRDSAVSCWITPLQKNEDFFCANGINRYICGVKHNSSFVKT